MTEEKNLQSDELEIDLSSLFMSALRILKKIWYVFPFVIILSGAIGGYVASARYEPYYKATATYTITLEDLPDNFYGQTAAKTLVATFPYILESSDLNRLVCEDLGKEVLNGSISASVLQGTNLLSVSVISSSPGDAYEILQSVIRIYPDIAVYVVGNTTLKLVISPSIPTEPENSAHIGKSIAVGAGIGLVLSIAFIAACAIIRPSFSTVENVKKALNFDRVATLPKINGATNIVIKDRSVNRVFYDAVGRLRTSVLHAVRGNGIKTILVTSTLQGEGKTTVAVNLALSLAHHGLKTLLVEGDLRNPSVLSTLGYDDLGVSFSDVIRGKHKLSECIIHEGNAIDVICEKSFNSDAAELITSDFVKKVVTLARDRYDYVIIDTPPLTAAPDALVLSEYVDGFVYVIRRDFAPAAVVSENVERFGYGMSRPICAVLNYANENGSSSYGRYGDYGYYGRK